MVIKKDGTHHWANSASHGGAGKLKFTSVICETEELYSVVDDKYYINYQPVTEEAFGTFAREQYAKKEVAWYNFSKATIATDFSAAWNNDEQQPQTIDADENTERPAPNAFILLPKGFDGKFLLVNSFVFIPGSDKALQEKYNVHPCDPDDDDCKYPFYNDYELWDDDDRYYKYPLSPNVQIEAGVWAEHEENEFMFATRKMTINQFVDYIRASVEYAVEPDDETAEYPSGVFANVIFENGAITGIAEH
jgi:hypothetical protein